VDIVVDLVEGGPACVPVALNGHRAVVVVPPQVCDQARTGTRWHVAQASPDLNDP
jgi:hypothetical protein